MNKNNKIIISVDGPAASGKGTISKRIASKFNLAYLDSGKLYRAVAIMSLQNKLDINNELEILKNIDKVEFDNLNYQDKKLLKDEVGVTASIIAKYEGIRKHLLKIQRNFAYCNNLEKSGVLIDGRDIGTVVLPDANIKFFITASIEERIDRRCKELISLGYNIIKRNVEQEMRDRDRRDRHRSNSPLLMAPNAILLDTTKLEVDAAYSVAKKHVEVYLNNFIG